MTFTVNALGRALSSGSYATNAEYYPNGQLKSFNYGNTLTFNQTLDAQQRPELRRVRKTSDMLSQQYSYDDNSNLTAILDSVTPANSVTNMTYDGLGRLKTANGFWGSGSFNYDTVGNITRKTLGTQDIIYNYDTNNRLASISGSLNQSFSYDSRFNVASNGLRTFTFNRANRLASSGTNSYVYDGHGRRIVKNKNGAKTYSLYNSAGVLMSTYESNGYTDYYYLGSQLVAKYADPRTQSDEPGYTGHVEDNDLQLTYMQARYYDPIIGRFYSNDPVGFTASNPMMFNRYVYANNNPYKYVDPDGKEPTGNMIAQMFGYTNVDNANTQAPKDIADGLQAAKGAVRTGAGDLSNATTLGAVGAGLLGQPQIAVPLAIVGGVSGFVEAALSDTPGKDLLVESVATVTGAKSVGTIAKIASGLAGESKQIQGAIKAVSEAGQHEISEVIKEDINE